MTGTKRRILRLRTGRFYRAFICPALAEIFIDRRVKYDILKRLVNKYV